MAGRFDQFEGPIQAGLPPFPDGQEYVILPSASASRYTIVKATAGRQFQAAASAAMITGQAQTMALLRGGKDVRLNFLPGRRYGTSGDARVGAGETLYARVVDELNWIRVTFRYVLETIPGYSYTQYRWRVTPGGGAGELSQGDCLASNAAPTGHQHFHGASYTSWSTVQGSPPNPTMSHQHVIYDPNGCIPFNNIHTHSGGSVTLESQTINVPSQTTGAYRAVIEKSLNGVVSRIGGNPVLAPTIPATPAGGALRGYGLAVTENTVTILRDDVPLLSFDDATIPKGRLHGFGLGTVEAGTTEFMFDNFYFDSPASSAFRMVV